MRGGAAARALNGGTRPGRGHGARVALRPAPGLSARGDRPGPCHPHQPQRRRHITAEQPDRPALPERRRHLARRLIGLRHRRRGRGRGRLGEAHDVNAGPRTLQRQPCHRLAQVGAPGVAIHDDHRVRPRESACRPVGRAVVPRPGGPVNGTPARDLPVRDGDRRPGRARPGDPVPRLRRQVLQPPQQLLRAGRRLFAVVGQQQATVLAVPGADMREPAQPRPLGGALLQRAGAVRADQDRLQNVGRVQRGELGDHRARQPGEPLARTGQTQCPHLTQIRGHRDGGQQARPVGRRTVGRAEPHGEGFRVAWGALPQPGPGAQGRQQQ